MPKIERTIGQKLECIRKAISNSQEHIKANDPRRVYSQYIRYALDEISDINFRTSRAAKGLKRNAVIHEHVIPHSIVMDKLLTLVPLTNDNILKMLKKYYVICAITKEEDKKLNAAGLRSKMPDGWKEDDSVFARYEEVGILVDNNT